MNRALFFFTALLVIATGVTPFDLIGHHISADPMIELALTAVVLIAIFLATE